MTNGARQLDLPDPSNEESEEAGTTRPEPSWFLRSRNLDSADQLVARYQASRGPLIDPRETHSGAGTGYRNALSAHPRPPAHFVANITKSAVRPEAEPASSRTGLRKTFLLAAALASLSGAAAGFIASQSGPVLQRLSFLAADLPSQILPSSPPARQAQQLQVVSASIIPKKPVPMASLKVSDVTGETRSLIPLALHAVPAIEGQDLLLKISGLPDRAYLTTGHRQNDKIWTLSLADLEGAKLMIPEAREKQIDVAVAAFEPKTGELVTPVKSMRIQLSDVQIEPASAPPPPWAGRAALPGNRPLPIPQPRDTKVSRAAQSEFASSSNNKADTYLKAGNLALARDAYKDAWNSGSPDAALGLARSYDPVVLASMKLDAASADSPTAIQWYERAAAAGNPEALGAIIRLRMKPN